jgi:two-component system sensor histidine kinase QseC
MKKLRKYSLLNRLFLTFLATSILTWGITSFITHRAIKQEVYDLFDDELIQSARVIQAFVTSLLHDGSLYEHWDLDHGVSILKGQTGDSSYDEKVAFQLWMANEGLILRSQNAPTFRFSESKQGFSKITVDDQNWDVFSLRTLDNDGDETYVIHVAQKNALRNEIIEHMYALAYKQFFVGLPILIVSIWLMIGISLRPVKRLTTQLKKRKANFLKPLRAYTLPKEILPLFNALNELFERLENSFENERRFTADASHELRTPLAGLLTQAQVALKTEDASIRNRALKQIENAAFRLTHMIKQLLILSRLEFESEALETRSTDLNQAIINVIGVLTPFVRKKQIDLSLNNQNTRLLTSNPDLLEVLIRNIIHNAIQYSPNQGTVKISVAQDKETVSFCVEDSGAGIPEQQREQVMQRFYRRIETSSATQGSGLGFSIVKQISDLHRAKLSLDKSSLGGLKVTLHFPLSKNVVKKKKQP